MVSARHPHCGCARIPDKKHTLVTLKLAIHLRETALEEGTEADLCHRQAVQALCIAAASILYKAGHSQASREEEISLAVLVALQLSESA